jgi:hypothetical protein
MQEFWVCARNIRKNLIQKFQKITFSKLSVIFIGEIPKKKSSKSEQNQWKEFKNNEFLQNFAKKTFKNANNFDEKFLKYWGLNGGKTCKSCRSRQELCNEYLLAKFGVDAEENEPYEVCSFGWKIRELFDIEPFN